MMRVEPTFCVFLLMEVLSFPVRLWFATHRTTPQACLTVGIRLGIPAVHRTKTKFDPWEPSCLGKLSSLLPVH